MVSPTPNHFSFDEQLQALWHPIQAFIAAKIPQDDAEDVFQLVCLDTFKSASDLKDKSKFKALAFTIARRRVCDFHRNKNRLLANQTSLIPDELKSFHQSPERSFLLKAIGLSIQGLSQPYRDIAKMHFVVGLSSAELAKILNMNTNTVKSYIRRSRQFILNQFKTEAPADIQAA